MPYLPAILPLGVLVWSHNQANRSVVPRHVDRLVLCVGGRERESERERARERKMGRGVRASDMRVCAGANRILC